jgi:ribonuclease III
MKTIASAYDLEKHINYKFHDPKILEEARTRKAYHNENPDAAEEFMDPLATLGDAVLDTIVIFKLYEDGVKEKGKLTIEKILSVKRENTRAFAEKIGLEKYILWGKGEDLDEIWNKGDKALDTVTEALIGAVYLDAQKRGLNGITVVKDMLERLKFF